MSERVVVVGGDAAGMSAASQAKRLAKEDLEVVALERGHHTSYSACGIPYWIGGDVESVDRLGNRNLIDAARQKIWEVVNDLATAEPRPRLRVALLQYGNDSLESETGYTKSIGFEEAKRCLPSRV